MTSVNSAENRSPASIHNAQNSAPDSGVTPRKRSTATALKRDESRRSPRAPTRLDLLAGFTEGQLRKLRTRFDAKWTPEPHTGCHLWFAALNTSGYGVVGLRKGGNAVYAHRLAYEMVHGAIAAGMDLDHKCNVRACVNPDHLEPVPHRENMRRGVERRNPLGLPERSTPEAHHHPASASPTDWRTRLHVAASSTGRRVVGGKRSAYESPLAARVERRGEAGDLATRLAEAQRDVRAGSSLLDAVADGTLWGWRAREALSHCLGEPLANWDRSPGRTQLERLALVARLLAELGGELRGGWRVGGAR